MLSLFSEEDAATIPWAQSCPDMFPLIFLSRNRQAVSQDEDDAQLTVKQELVTRPLSSSSLGIKLAARETALPECGRLGTQEGIRPTWRESSDGQLTPNARRVSDFVLTR